MVQTSRAALCVALMAFLSVMGANAQTPCQSVVGMQNLNATKLTGVWYESVRAPAANVGCIEIHIESINNDTELAITTWSSSSLSSSYMDQQQSVVLNTTVVNANTGFNVTYNTTNAVTTTYKVVGSDNNYISLCGYTSPDTNTSFGLILTASRSPNATWLQGVVNTTSQVLSNFNSTLAVNVPQMNCYASSASTTLPVLSSVFATIYLFMKFLN
uniref:Putative lipocalin / cytosolic fatty-acid binding protein family n=2 Tax=Haematobia irritans TaxID=7368 RepID=A0A1L8EG62_HAEIR